MPTFNRKVRVVLDWRLALFFRRDVVSLGQIQHPRRERVVRLLRRCPARSTTTRGETTRDERRRHGRKSSRRDDGSGARGAPLVARVAGVGRIRGGYLVADVRRVGHWASRWGSWYE
jgi:hypothetical protein